MRINLKINSLAAAGEQLVLGVSFFAFYGILIRQVGVDLVGVLSLILILTSIGSLASAGFASTISYFVPLFEGRNERSSTVRCVETTMLFTTALYAVVLILAYAPFEMLISTQVGAEHRALVNQLLPTCVVYVVFQGAVAVATLTLTALQRSDLRFLATLAGATVGLVVVVWGTPRFGVVAGLWGLAVQAAVTLAVSWTLIRRLLPDLGAIPFRFDGPIFCSLWKLGLNMQAQTVLTTALDPMLRLLMGHFGSLAAVTYSTMASRYVLQVRALIFSGAQPLLSALSVTREQSPDDLGRLYDTARTVTGFAALALISAAVGASAFIGEVWIGERRDDFVTFTVLLASGWLVNTMVLTDYFNAYSLGRMGWNLIGHIFMFTINLGLGIAIGSVFGGIGVVLAMALAILVSSLLMGVRNMHHAPPGEHRTLVRTHAFLGVSSVVAAASALTAYGWLRAVAPPLAAGVACGSIWLIVVAPSILVHPATTIIMAAFRRPGPILPAQ